jgi:hypothetical protein
VSAQDDLVRAVGANDVDAVHRALAAGADPNAPDANGRALFAAIVSWATPEIVRVFLRAGATIAREPDAEGWTFVHAAATRGDAELLDVLLARGVAPSARSKRTGMTPLETAAWYGHEACVARLLRAGVGVASDPDHPSALARATFRGHDAIAALLRAHGAKPEPERVAAWPPRDWDDVEGWDRYARWSVVRAAASTEALLPLADATILRALWRPRGPKRRMLLVGPGISFLPRLFMLGGDDVVVLDRSPVAVAFARETKIHRSFVEWFLATLDEGRELAPTRGETRFCVGDVRDPDHGGAVEGPFDHVVATALLHGFSAADRARIFTNVARWLSADGLFHVGLYGAAKLVERLPHEAQAHGLGERVRLWTFGS